MLERILMATAALALAAGTATAATVKNTGSEEFTIGVDMGNEEKVEKVAAGKTMELDCKDGCGVTGPWGFSWWLVQGDTIASDGSSMVTVTE